MDIASESIAYWFFRLNGFMTIQNFVVHPDVGRMQRTDVDVLGVRFPHRAENQARPMDDHPEFSDAARLQVVLVETKRSRCEFNDTWTDPTKGNLERILHAAGVHEASDVPTVAAALYATGVSTDAELRTRLVAVGATEDAGIRARCADVPQLLWARDVLPFIHHRFWSYRNEKRMHNQWDADAHNLFNAVLQSRGDATAFIANVNITNR